MTLHRNFVKDLVDVSPNKLAYLIKGTGFRSAALNTRGLFYQCRFTNTAAPYVQFSASGLPSLCWP